MLAQPELGLILFHMTQSQCCGVKWVRVFLLRCAELTEVEVQCKRVLSRGASVREPGQMRMLVQPGWVFGNM